MAFKDSQTSMFLHSEVKVRLLKTYLERYLNILNESKYVDDVFIYDLFCGEGVYENNGKGSPIIILETIEAIHRSNLNKSKSTIGFHCRFNDLNSEKVKKLERIISYENLFDRSIGSISYSEKNYEEILPIVIESIKNRKNSKAFVFIDPYGYKKIRVSNIKSLLELGNTEVLLFLPTRDMFRFIERGTPQCLKDFISELVNESEWPKSATGLDFIDNLTSAFRENLKGYFVDSFVISRDINQFFCLFFFTSHIYGFDRMLDAKWEIDKEEGRGWSYENESNLFSTEKMKPNVYKFEKKIEDKLSGGALVGNKDMYLFTLSAGHLPKHTNQILRRFQNEGKLKVFDLKGKPARRGSFYIGYKYFKEENERVKMKI